MKDKLIYILKVGKLYLKVGRLYLKVKRMQCVVIWNQLLSVWHRTVFKFLQTKIALKQNLDVVKISLFDFKDKIVFYLKWGIWDDFSD